MSGTPTEDALNADVAALAGLERLPCSPGEAQAAAWIAQRLRATGGARRVVVDEERVHGTYFTPLGVLNALGAAGGAAVLGGRRALGGAAAALAATGIWQDLTGGSERTLRRALKRQLTTNVVAEYGAADAAHTLVVHAHHDAARTSFIFDQTVAQWAAEHGLMDKTDRWPPLMGLVFGGPALVALGALAGNRRAAAIGAGVAAATAGVMAHMAREPVVPGANDNLSGVAVLLEVARRLSAGGGPPEGVRVILLSAGAEEANQEGMLAFGRRYFGPGMTPADTSFLSLDTVGSPELVLIEGEGFLRMYEYPSQMKERVAEAARAAGVHVRRGLRFTFATDGLIPLRQGYQAASIGSVTEHLVPSNYHWPTDTADRVHYATVADCAELVMATIARSDEPLS
jgi:hypothetical protein